MTLARFFATFILVPLLLVAGSSGGNAHAQGRKDPRKPDTSRTDPQKTEAAHLKSAADVLMD